MVRLATKPSQRFDCALFFYVAALLVGSAIWLRLIPSGDLTGRGIQSALWMEAGLQRTEDGRALPSVSGLELSIQQDVCNFTSADDASGCGADNPQITVTASIQSHAYVTRGVSLAVYSSNDFEFWRQANSVLLPRDMFHAVDRGDTAGPMAVSTMACFGEPGAYYVVACAREGVPPGGSASASARPSCQMPPCANSVGPPFSMCLAVATACISTCDTGAVEVIPQRQYVRGQRSSRCANSTIPMSLLFANEGSDVSAAFIVFMLCYTVGIVYFMIMYLPGIGANDAVSPSWDLFLSAVLEDGHVVVKLSSHAKDAAPRLLKSTRAMDVEASQEAEVEKLKKCAEVTRRLVKGRVTAAADFHKRGGDPSPTWREGGGSGGVNALVGPANAFQRAVDPGSAASAEASNLRVRLTEEKEASMAYEVAHRASVATMRFRRPTMTLAATHSSQIELFQAPKSAPIPPIPGLPPDAPSAPSIISNPVLALKTFEEAELEMHSADNESEKLLTKFRRTVPKKSMLRFEIDEMSVPPYPPPPGPPVSTINLTTSKLSGRASAADIDMIKQKANEFGFQAELKGVTPVMFSISASEGPNILLRNFLGKIVTNLSIGLELGRLPNWHLVDGFADEGHRIGAYYLFRATSIAFYESLNPSIALRVVSSWLEAINGHAHASSVDKFDKEKQTDLFALLPAVDQARPQICFVKFFHQVFRSLNAFTVTIDALFDCALSQPFASPGTYTKMVQLTQTSDINEKCVMEATGISSVEEARVLLVACRNQDGPPPHAFSLAKLMSGGLVRLNTEHALPTTPDETTDIPERQEPRIPTFFSAEFVNTFGHLLSVEFLDTVEDGDHLHFGAYMACIRKLDAKDPLRCTAFTKLAPALPPTELGALLNATKRRWLSYDHVKVVAGAMGRCKAMYIARGRPDQWKPETKKDHRRVIMPGCWACRTPEDSSDDEFWASRREIALIHGVAEHHVVAHFYADLLNVDTDERGAHVKEGVDRKDIKKVKVLNTHLGKAGGLNFGIEAMLHLNMVPKPSPTHPIIFAIVDARHSSDSRWWNHILPSFFEVHSIEDRVMFNPDIVLCQVPHSYIGMNAITDKLDVQNNFFFDGMACFRDRCNGMTSCGTGGIWSITSHLGVENFFFGRTMIEDTTSTHKYFLQGFYSTYVPPLFASKQLMRAVPKIGANYVDALERWDTGAVQSLLTQGLPNAWFWITLCSLLLIGSAVMVPAFTAGVNLLAVWRRPWESEHVFSTCLLLYSAGVFTVLITTILTMAVFSRPALNWCLRFLVCFFNVTYPVTSVFGLFWIGVPPFVAFTGTFPFTLNAQYAAFGSLVLKCLEFGAVAKLQALSHLDEHSIGMTQKMDKVAVPIKIRAILKGVATGWNDRYYYHDNSWWVSFGASATLMWIRRWLILLMSVQIITLIAAVTHLIIVAAQGVGALLEKAMPLLYASLAALHYVWLLSEPFMYLMQGSNILAVPPRWLEVGISLLMIGGIFGFLEATRIVSSAV